MQNLLRTTHAVGTAGATLMKIPSLLPATFRLPSAIVCVLLAMVLADILMAQTAGPAINPDRLTKPWPAQWIAHPTADKHDFGVFHFRKQIALDQIPDQFVVHVSADNRYQLFVNGENVSMGPARGDVDHWRFETVDIAPHLRTGTNTLAAVVWNFGDHAPMAQHTFETGFIVQGNEDAEADVNTDGSWRVFANPAYEPIPMTNDIVDGYYVAGPGERINGAAYPWNWQMPDFDDSGWPSSRELLPGYPRGTTSHGGRLAWMLVPRAIPQMEAKSDPIPSLRRSEGIDGHDGFLSGTQSLEIPPNTSATLLVDRTHLTTAYPELTVSGGTGASISLRYAESLFHERRIKGNRDDIDGKYLYGNVDTFFADGADSRTFRPLWFRTYRYIQLEIETANDALSLDRLTGTFTGFPFLETALFSSDDPGLAKVWEVGWRTARLCAGEHYYDCPYYEQLQYVGDTRIQALISMYVAGDDRLVRRSLSDFDHSRIPEGITASRYPSRLPQYIPTYALFWVSMIHDYWMLREDPAFIGGFLTGIRGVVDWYSEFVDDTGLLGPMPWWSFVDWANEYDRGIPPGAQDGNSCVISLQYAYTLDQAADLASYFERDEEAENYRRMRSDLVESIQNSCWDNTRGLFAETPEKTSYSQHANMLAILTDIIPVENQARMLERILADDSLIQATFYFQFYLHEALMKTGLGDRYIDEIAPWREMLDLGLTTFAEKPDPTRSDCHAWSASPNYFLLSLVAGIRPAEPGFKSVVIQPHLGPLEHLEAGIDHPAGPLSLSLKRTGQTGLAGEVVLPPGVNGTFLWNKTNRMLRPGRNVLDM